jgi:hypothetical protein
VTPPRSRARKLPRAEVDAAALRGENMRLRAELAQAVVMLNAHVPPRFRERELQPAIDRLAASAGADAMAFASRRSPLSPVPPRHQALEQLLRRLAALVEVLDFEGLDAAEAARFHPVLAEARALLGPSTTAPGAP